MKKLALILGCAVILLGMMVLPGMATSGFDEYGYNDNARIFNGLFGNSDRDDDGNPDTYRGRNTAFYDYFGTDKRWHKVRVEVAGARLIMKWSEAYANDAGSEGAWYTNRVRGTGTIIHKENTIYEGRLTIFAKIQWVDNPQDYTIPLKDGFVVAQLVISGQGVAVLEIPPGLGTR